MRVQEFRLRSNPDVFTSLSTMAMIKKAAAIRIFFFTLLLGICSSVFGQDAGTAGGFILARLHYGGGGDWYANPTSLPNLLKFIAENTDIKVNMQEAHVNISDDALFSYPYIYMTGHGNVRLKDDEVNRLRIYLTNGGFLHADDNYGMDQSFRREIRKVFPDKEWIQLPFNHEIYHSHFDFQNGIPKIHEHDGGPGQGFALFHEGRMVVFYSFNTDLGDGWEDQDVHDNQAEIRRAALEMGTNIVVYVLTQ